MKFKFKKSFCRSAACIGLTAVMSATCIAGNVFAFSGGGNTSLGGDSGSTTHSLAFESANGKVDLTDIKLGNLSQQAMVNDNAQILDTVRTVIVSLDSQPLALRDNPDAAAREEIEREQNAFLNDLTKAGVRYTNFFDCILKNAGCKERRVIVK